MRKNSMFSWRQSDRLQLQPCYWRNRASTTFKTCAAAIPGFRFQWLNYLNDVHWGGILADDMGLIKQSRPYHSCTTLNKNETLKALVVCPTTLMYNWENEIKIYSNPNLLYTSWWSTNTRNDCWRKHRHHYYHLWNAAQRYKTIWT